MADEQLNRITAYDPEGNFLFKWGNAGDRAGQISGPSGLAFDSNDFLYITDQWNGRIQKFTPDGQHIAEWGRKGKGNGQFNMPWGISIDDDGKVYVADWRNDRIQKFTKDGKFLSCWGSSGDGNGQFNRPWGITIDTDGDIYVADWGNNRVQIYEPDGEIITSLYGDATEFSKAGQYNLERDPESVKVFNRNEGLKLKSYLSKFGRPIGITIDKNNRIIITDGRGRLHVYVKDQEYAEPPV